MVLLIDIHGISECDGNLDIDFADDRLTIKSVLDGLSRPVDYSVVSV